EIASIPAADFIRGVLIGHLNARVIVCGEDHRFGARGAGDTELLKRVCREAGVGVEIVPPVTRSGKRISSTDIRALLEAGRIEDARALLGHEV
ncbi:MAG: hypothetical protein IKX16_03230, partial [Clostridia bacterium]|nr:hypothetical protein [Clostridia bacterium]